MQERREQGMEDDSLVLGLSICRVDIDAIVMGTQGGE